MGAMAGVSLVLFLVGIVVAILWILMPFLIMGTNRRLDKLIAQNAELLSRSPRP
jgi:hypothetical protein